MFKFLIVLALASPISTWANSSFDLRIISYNIKGLPPLAGGYNRNRFTEIGRLLEVSRRSADAAHIVALQEAFILDTNLLLKAARFPFELRGPQANFGKDEAGRNVSKLYGSGLILLSESEIKRGDDVVFGTGNCKTWDCYANKGVQSGFLDNPNLPFLLPILNTHMQAGREHEAIRKVQNGIISRFIKRSIARQAFIFAGDFNFRQTQGSYHDFLSQIPNITNSAENCVNSPDSCEISSDSSLEEVLRSNVDHQFYSNGVLKSRDGLTQYQVSIQPLYIRRGFREIFEGRQLSDHLSYEVTFRIYWTELESEIAIKS